MNYIDFMGPLHKSTRRDYLARVNDKEFPKFKASTLAKKWDYDYWDGDRRINYGGYNYIPGRWEPVAKLMADKYKINSNSKILDIGCGKGFQLYEFKKLFPTCEVNGIDISSYAIKNAKTEVKDFLKLGCASSLPWPDDYFDYVFSINTLHNLCISKLFNSIKEINRVSKGNAYICIESYRNELEKQNLLYWQVTCESFYSTDDWLWIFDKNGYDGDYSFIFFE